MLNQIGRFGNVYHGFRPNLSQVPFEASNKKAEVLHLFYTSSEWSCHNNAVSIARLQYVYTRRKTFFYKFCFKKTKLVPNNYFKYDLNWSNTPSKYFIIN